MVRRDSIGTVPQLARACRLSERAIRNYAANGKIKRVGWDFGPKGHLVPTYDAADVMRAAADRRRNRDAGWLVAWMNTPDCPVSRTDAMMEP